MAYIGKFKDRCPIICAAGKPNQPNMGLGDVLQEYPLVDQIEAIKHDIKLFNEKLPEKRVKFPPTLNTQHRGLYDDIINDIKMPPKTRYQQLITDLKETSYRSFWKTNLGKTPDVIGGLPKEVDVLTTTFGHKPYDHIPLYEVIMPNISRYQVLVESQINHDNYKKIFKDYNAGEKIDRNYFKPPYDPTACAGYQTIADNRGRKGARGTQWFNQQPFSIVSRRQADFINRYKPKLEKVLAPIGNEKCVPKGHTFGRLYPRDIHGMAELLKPGCEPSEFKRHTAKGMASLNTLRRTIKSKFSSTFNLLSLEHRFAFHDKDETGYIPLEKFYYVIGCLKINMNRENLEMLFRDFNIITSDMINYRAFIKSLEFDMELGKQLDPLPSDKLYYLSQMQASNLDKCFIDNSVYPAAGYSIERSTDSVKSFVHRSILQQYGLSYHEMHQKRSKDFIALLFKNCGYEFEEGAFDALYEIALEKDRNGGVCVETFNEILKKHHSPLTKIPDNSECMD